MKRIFTGIVALLVVGCTSQSLTSSLFRSADEAPAEIELELGESITINVSVHCGYEKLEVVVNGEFWRTDGLSFDEAGNPTEPAWPQGSPSAELELTLIKPDVLRVTAPTSNVSHSYHPFVGEAWCE